MKWIRYDLKVKQSLLLFLLYSFVAAGLTSPIASESIIPQSADYINHLAGIIQAKSALAEGQFPLRVAPLELEGLRYPFFQFYAPTTYTLAGILYQWITPHNPMIAYNIIMWLSLVAAGIYMYRLVFWFIDSYSAAILASLVYMASPYYIVVINNMGYLSETFALGLIPACLFYTIQRYFHPNNNTLLLKTGLVWYLLITVHLVTFVYTSFFIGLFLFFLTCKNYRRLQNLASTGIAYALALILALWHLAPIFYLKSHIVMSQTYQTHVHFTEHKQNLSELLFPGVNKFSGSLLSYHPAIGWIIIISAIICIYLSFMRENDRKGLLLPLVILFFIAFLFIWSPFDFWFLLPKVLLIGQYNWRFSSQIIWIGALLFAFAIAWVFDNKLDHRHTVIGIFLIMMAGSTWLPRINDSRVDLDSFIKQGYLIYNTDTYTIYFNRYTQFIDDIHNLVLYSLVENNLLRLDTPYIFPNTLLDHTYRPFVLLEGTIVKPPMKDVPLIAEINGMTVAKLNIKPGKFSWKIPIDQWKKQFKNPSSLSLKFKMNLESFSIPVDKLILSGFLKPDTVLSVAEVKKTCHIKKTNTVCKINVGNSIQLIELPILYYPKLLEITLNGKKIPYRSILYNGRLITSVTPQAGKENTIQIRFIGLKWANTISGLGWCIWLYLLALSLRKENQ